MLSHLICTPHGKHSGIHMRIFGNDLSVIQQIDTQLTITNLKLYTPNALNHGGLIIALSYKCYKLDWLASFL